MVLLTKNKSKVKSTTLLLLMTGSFTFNSPKVSEANQINNQNQMNLATLNIDSLGIKPVIKNKLKLLELSNTIKIVKDKFNKVNPEINKEFAEHFVKVSDHYNLHPENSYDLFISQLLVESRGRHKTKKGNVLIGSAGEVGISQIIPSTALFFIKHKMSKSEILNIKKLGADDLSHIDNEQKANEWLKKEKNNIVIWGYIMRYNINRSKGDICDGFVAYNTGFGGLNKFKKNGNTPKNHSYYKKIKNMSERI